ncbi:MAG: hypothetical protein KJZ72_13945 [Anaerolineales bacterium]|nr:hypothetical protein [Anaerolineales bacterium]
MRAPDGWESPRFQALCVAEGWFRQNGVISSRPPAGIPLAPLGDDGAHRWADKYIRLK